MHLENSKNTFAYVFLSIVFTMVFIAIPWETVVGHKFIDRSVYLNYFRYEVNVLEYRKIDGLLGLFKNEALWHYIIPLLKDKLHISLETIFTGITAVCIFVFAYFIVSRKGSVSLFFLASPLLLAFAMSQLRNALAFSLLLLAYMSRKWIVTFLLILPALFIHSSILLVLCIYWVLHLTHKGMENKSFGGGTVFVICVCLGAGISILIGPLLDIVLAYIGDRRATIYSKTVSSSLLYTSFWIGLLFISAFQRKSFYQNIVNQYSIVMLSLVTCNIFTGGYTLRFLSMALPMLIYTILDFDDKKKNYTAVAYFIYLIFQWLYWFEIKVL